ncbi:MAG: DUF92 domain-containing protein [Bacteroidetes bacterium SW_9_63_38]|nr:MAG: DUF92 domain-containing protein [Bacteroidetes bacterium SW_9_63_38]
MVDWIALFVSFVSIAGVLLGAEGLHRLGVSTATTRRIVHLIVCFFVASTPWLFSESAPVCGLAALFVIMNGAARARGWWPGIHAAHPRSWGTVAVPLAVLPAAAIAWSGSGDHRLAFQTSFLVLGLADPLAAVVGHRYGIHSLTKTASAAGTGVFAATTSLLVGAVLVWAGRGGPQALGAAVGAGGVAAAVEAIGQHGWDNLFIVVAVVVVLVALQRQILGVPGLLGSVGIGGVVAGGAWGLAVLTRRGAVGAGLFAATLVGLGGWAWAAPGFAFFMLSSALSVLPGGGGDRPSRRLRQVLANGGVAWGLLLIALGTGPNPSTGSTRWYIGFLGALAAAAADTWATELGTRYGGPPWSLWEGRRVAFGTSGAVSYLGTGGAALGALSVVAAPALSGTIGGDGLLCGAGAGLAGMAADSLLGAIVQARYKDPETGRMRDTPIPGDDSVQRGWRWIDNDIVNLVGTAVGAGTAVALIQIV